MLPTQSPIVVGAGAQPVASDGTESTANDPGGDEHPEFTLAAVAAAVRAEQWRIARALHDTVAQTLTGTYFLASITTRKLEGSGSEAAEDMAHLTEMIHRAVREVQEVARMLQPEAELTRK